MDELTADERRLIAIERARCKKSFLYFLKYAKIVEAPTRDNPGGVIELQLWSHIKQMVRDLLDELLLVWLKSRQIGASWLVACWCLWNALFHRGDTSMLFSKGEIEAMELLSKCRRVYSQLPSFLKLKLNPDSATEMGFPTMMSTIKALAATETAGISFTASRVVCDEWEQHPYAEQNYLAAKPTIDNKGQFIGIFTVDKLKPITLAKTVYTEATEGNNNFKKLFFPYHVRPGRDDAWYEYTKRNIPQSELGALTPELYMEQNYPASEEEALRPTSDVSAFQLEALDRMMTKVDLPVEIKEEGIDTKIVHIYKPYLVGEAYIASSDVGHGIGKDYSVTPVMNVKTGEVVADIFHNKLPPEELAYHSVKLLGLYKNPLWFPEDNDWGRVTIAIAQQLGYKRFGEYKKDKLGFHTEERSRFDLWGALIPAINSGQITIYNKEGLRQFYDIIRNVKENGRIEATKGRHDDYPMAVGICWLKRNEAKVSSAPLKPVETLTFARR